MRFEFATATQIIFGAGTLQEVGPLTAKLGARALVVGGGTAARLTPLLELLRVQGVSASPFSVPTEPTLDLVTEGVQEARARGCDVVIGMGGGRQRARRG